ncbi:MAG: DUF1501 domain-containing protein [Planctomycetaceae bacterium]|nr:DUF1501 domain-containing protein [Planctomycetaceae bacterium]
MHSVSRRRFLNQAGAGAAVLTLGGFAPDFLQSAAARSKNERILVVVEMAGGNDGLNSVVPFADDEYQKLRPKLALTEMEVIRVNDQLGFHPSLRGFADLLEQNQLAVVQGVGYDNPSRSHFESMDIWHTCLRKNETRNDGWLGRFLESAAPSENVDPLALHLGADKQPFALMSREVRVPSIRSLEQFRLNGIDREQFRIAVQELTDARSSGTNDLLGFVQSSTSSAIAASKRIETTGQGYTPAKSYPATGLGEKLKTVAGLIASGLSTKVFYVQIDGFDTHSQQPNAHAGLLRQVGDAVHSFVSDMVAQGHGDEVAVMCFSEFGRRVAENASEGTDHGTAGPMFIAGTKVKAGLIGDLPSLQDLQEGDLKHHTDFRQVYAAVLEDWLQCSSQEVLRGRFQPVPVFG